VLSDHAVTGVRVLAGNRTLYESPHAAGNSAHHSEIRVISRKIYSPFDAADLVGEISLYTSDAEIRSQARRYSSNMAVVLGLQVAFVAAGVALVVFFLITRPIRGISNELHRLQLSTGTHLRIPPGNQSDEIGRLVSDVNALITRLTSLLDTERELRIEHEVQERKMKLIFDKAETGLFVLDPSGAVQSWNPAFVRILDLGGRMPPGVAPQRLHELLAPHGRSVDELLQRCLTTRTPCEIDLEISRPGALHSEWIELSINPIGPAVLQGVINDVTDRKRMELSARRLASHDALTGLLNRHGMASSLDDLFKHSSPKRVRETAVVQIDLDFFKQVNDTYGHEGGDRVLCQVARVLEDTVRRSDVVGRQGGDEFIAVLVGIEASAKALEIADNLIARINQPIDLGDGNWAQVSASIGIAFPSSPDDTPTTVLRRADAAMYEAKQRGRSQAYVAPCPTAPGSGSAATRGAA
jgi:diguanylate cyclase (GGDEF)-like protein/PAS domain S-box-containing protein